MLVGQAESTFGLVRSWTLQRQLRLGIGAALAFLLLFFLIAGPAWKALESFVHQDLKPDLALAQAYDRVLTEWVRVHKTIPELPEQLLRQTTPIGSVEGLASCVRALDAVVDRIGSGRSRERYLEASSCISSYSNTLQLLQKALERRRRLGQEETRRRSAVTQTLSVRTQELVQGFKPMVDDFARLMKSPEFMDRQSGASDFVLKISRIEKDLVVIQSDLNLYIQYTETQREFDSQGLTQKILKRLNAVLALLERSIAESQSAAQRRALDRIRNSLAGIKSSFAEVRDLGEKADSEVIELDEEVTQLRRSLTQSYQYGVELVFTEAEALKVRVEQKAVELAARSRSAYLTSMVFLVIVLVVGLILLKVYPARVSNDLQSLSNQIGSYQIGTALNEVAPLNTQELRDLRGAFCELADRLTGQVSVIGRYTGAIERMGDVFATLHQHSEEPGSGEQALREAVYRALEQLAAIEGLSLAKVMVRRRIGGQVVLAQLGEEYVAGEFAETVECREYQKKHSWKLSPVVDPKLLVDFRDIMPNDEGISGWLLNYWDAPEGRVTSFDSHRDLIANRQFLQRNMVIPVVGEQKQLEKRQFERGLMGAVFGVKIPWLADQQTSRRRARVKEKGPVEREFVPNEQGMIGVLFLYFSDRETRISEQERLFAQIIGGQIAQLIHAYLMIDQQKELQKLKYHLQMAAEIQEHLLPAKNRVPRHPNVRISVVCKPAGDVGGDYYDFPFPPYQPGNSAANPPDTIHAIIADASGKNIPAALLMTILKTAIASMDIGKMRPHEVLMTANLIINKCITSDRFITALYLILHTQTGIVEVSSAGHCLPIHISPKGAEPRIHQLRAKSLMPLGIMEDTRYETDKFQLSPGDSLFLYTDGVIEARNDAPDPEEYGMDRLKKFLLRENPGDFSDALLAEIGRFRGDAPQHDDITAVLVKWTGGKS